MALRKVEGNTSAGTKYGRGYSITIRQVDQERLRGQEGKDGPRIDCDGSTGLLDGLPGLWLRGRRQG